MSLLLLYFKLGLGVIWAGFKNDPAGWITVIILFFTFLIGMIQVLKRIKVSFVKWGHEYQILGTNIGLRKVNITHCGFKEWNGHKEERAVSSESVIIDGEDQQRFDMYKIVDNSYVYFKNLNGIYYGFVKDGSGKTYKGYTHFVVVSWIIRLYYLMKYGLQRLRIKN